jgi:hypothetical protein
MSRSRRGKHPRTTWSSRSPAAGLCSGPPRQPRCTTPDSGSAAVDPSGVRSRSH